VSPPVNVGGADCHQSTLHWARVAVHPPFPTKLPDRNADSWEIPEELLALGPRVKQG
jgi:hypothetical protein